MLPATETGNLNDRKTDSRLSSEGTPCQPAFGPRVARCEKAPSHAINSTVDEFKNATSLSYQNHFCTSISDLTKEFIKTIPSQTKGWTHLYTI